MGEHTKGKGAYGRTPMKTLFDSNRIYAENNLSQM